MTRQQRIRLAPRLTALFEMPRMHRVENDPISIVRRYRDPKEIELVGWLASSLAYGRVSLFRPVIEQVLSLSNGSFYLYLRGFNLKKERYRFDPIYYRFNTSSDILCLVYLMSQIVQQYGGVKPFFLSCYREEDIDLGETLSRFITGVTAIDTQPVYHTAEKPYGLLYFLPDPAQGSSCKRLNLYLRWMVRPDDGIDFGLWNEIPPSKLIIPLDTHIARIGGYLGLTSRKTADLKMAREITKHLKRFDPDDPLKYDFPLCHLGISQDCPASNVPIPEKCRVCLLQPACKRGIALL